MPDKLLRELEKAAKKLRRSKKWIINEAVTACLARGQRKAQMLEETREALADIKTGRVVDSAEVMDWLETWGTDKEKSLSKSKKLQFSQSAERDLFRYTYTLEPGSAIDIDEIL